MILAGQPALVSEEPGDGDGLADGHPIVLQQGHLTIGQRGLPAAKLAWRRLFKFDNFSKAIFYQNQSSHR